MRRPGSAPPPHTIAEVQRSHPMLLTLTVRLAQVGLSVLSFLWLPPQLAKCTFYMFLSCVLYVNIGRCA
jgi:hypothetical protein